MSASNRGWSSLSGRSDRRPGAGAGAGERGGGASPDRWIWGVWVAVALLPFASRLDGVARAIARFCGFSV